MCDQKKLLVLGGKPIGSLELVERAKKLGLYVIVADFLPPHQSPAKLLADEAWEVSTAELDTLEQRCLEIGVDGILTAVHEFNINRMIDLCERLNKPCYCKRSTWQYCDNKLSFKALCESNGIPVAKKYDLISDVRNYPVIVKPVDGSGSRGFSICRNAEELNMGYNKAIQFSPSKTVLIEDYIPYDAVIIHYTMNHGQCLYSGMSDKFSAKFPSTGASVMGLQTFPSVGEESYLKNLDAPVRRMFENAGFTDGPIWIEAFYDGKNQFIFNEMGYRFGGSLTNYPVRYFYNIEQLDLMIDVALGGSLTLESSKKTVADHQYCILPVHIKPGTITEFTGLNLIKNRDDLYAYVPVHYQGDVIEEWGSAQQVFCYLHILFKDTSNLKASIRAILKDLQVFDEHGANMLYTLFDFDKL